MLSANLEKIQGLTFPQTREWFFGLSVDDRDTIVADVAIAQKERISLPITLMQVYYGYVWQKNIFFDTDTLTSLFTDGLLFVIVDDVDLVPSLLRHLHTTMESNTTGQSDEAYIGDIFTNYKNAVFQSKLEVLSGENKLSLSELITEYEFIKRKGLESIEMAEYLSKLRNIIVSHIQKLPEHTFSEEDIHDFTAVLKEVIDFFTSVNRSAVYPLAIQHKFPDAFKNQSEVENDISVPELVTAPNVPKISAFVTVKEQIEEAFGPLSQVPTEQMNAVYAVLSAQATALDEQKLQMLIIFNESSEAFEWNEDLLDT